MKMALCFLASTFHTERLNEEQYASKMYQCAFKTDFPPHLLRCFFSLLWQLPLCAVKVKRQKYKLKC